MSVAAIRSALTALVSTALTVLMTVAATGPHISIAVGLSA